MVHESLIGPRSKLFRMEFPPNDAEDEKLLGYLYHEVDETWSFASLNLHCSHLSMFWIRKGYIGLSQPNTRSGDRVVVLLEAPVPIVLREYKEGYSLIGQRYAHPFSWTTYFNDLLPIFFLMSMASWMGKSSRLR